MRHGETHSYGEGGDELNSIALGASADVYPLRIVMENRLLNV